MVYLGFEKYFMTAAIVFNGNVLLYACSNRFQWECAVILGIPIIRNDGLTTRQLCSEIIKTKR